jgi:molybdopterin molybdotransferase
MLPFEEARAKVIEVLLERASHPQTETVEMADDPAAALGRILAEDILADRNYPPFNRSIRDGFAVRAADTAEPGARLRLVGESRAGVAFTGTVGSGECVRILTGAAVPKGANAVVMQEHTRPDDDCIVLDQPVRAAQHYVLAGAEARVGEIVVPRGSRLGYAELAMVAQAGRAQLTVYRKPRVGILATGDELVEIDQVPDRFQIRNTNTISLAAQTALAGGHPVPLGGSSDEPTKLRAAIERALESDIAITSGGVSVGEYDRVEGVLRDLGAEVFFDALAIRPGKPAVFSWCQGKPVFGLPGNPVSTMVTFELLVAPAIDMLSGHTPGPLPFFKARLAHPLDEKAGVAHFLPARVQWSNGIPVVEVQLWEGSGDIGAVVRANCFLVVHPFRLHLEAGEWVDVFPRRGVF